MTLVCHSVLPPKPKAQPGWFEENKELLITLINSRNVAMEILQRRTRQTSAKLKEVRKKLKREVKAANFQLL